MNRRNSTKGGVQSLAYPPKIFAAVLVAFLGLSSGFGGDLHLFNSMVVKGKTGICGEKTGISKGRDRVR